MKRKKRPSTILVVVAHPDDEALFFSSVLMKYKKKCHVICVTDGNADGLGSQRQEQFGRSCQSFGAGSYECLGFPDRFDMRLDVSALKARLSNYTRFKKIFTHGIIGEYGHKHHQDVSFSVHEIFKKAIVFSCAYNIDPQLRFNLSPAQFALKTRVLWNIYENETKKLINFLPATAFEGFRQITYSEVAAIYRRLTGRSDDSDLKKIKIYTWLKDYLWAGGNLLSSRPF